MGHGHVGCACVSVCVCVCVCVCPGVSRCVPVCPGVVYCAQCAGLRSDVSCSVLFCGLFTNSMRDG